jgi:hypothetical protein
MMKNVRVPSATRPMTTAEKYYAFLDLVWPSNPILSADLGVCLPVDKVEARWREFCAQRVYTRLMPTSDLTVVDAGLSRIAFSARTMPRADWAAQVARDADTAYGLERVTRLHYLASPDEGLSFLYFVGHHSIADGRGGLMELQAFLRFLDDRDVPVQDEISRPAPGRAEYAWQTDRRALLDVLRDLSDRNRELGHPLPDSWPPASPERTSRLTPITLSHEASEVVLSRARAEGVRVFSSMASAWLQTVAHSVCSSDDGVLQLNVPVDRSVPSDDPRRPTAMAVGVVANRFRVQAGGQWPLAREIATTVERALDRGEGELFFHLARLDNVVDLTKGAEMVGAGITTAAPAVSVTNMGVLDPSDDPPWVLGMWGNLAATPNQVISFSTVGYRGRLCCTLWTDDVRVAPSVTAALASGFVDALA